jgi:hypothetical protein
MTNRSTKFSVAIAGALLVVSTVAGCGGSSNDAYCEDMKKADKDFSAMGSGDFAQLEKAFKTFHTLADEAPSEVEADWKVLDSAITAMEKGFEEAGIDFSDLSELQNGKVPEGVDTKKLTELSATMSKFSGPKFEKASNDIAKHAKEECNVDIQN